MEIDEKEKAVSVYLKAIRLAETSKNKFKDFNDKFANEIKSRLP